MQKHILFGLKILLAILVGVTIILGFVYTGFYFGYQAGADKAWSLAGQAIDETGVFPDGEEAAFNLKGEITKIDVANKKIYFNAEQPSQNPLAPRAPVERVASLDKNYSIIKVIEKSADQLAAEELAYEKNREAARQAGTETPLRQKTFTEMVYPLESLNVGDKITVSSEADIYWSESFIAKEIRVY
ncbi:MAG: hypothetical protein PHD51_00960 [Patescibacteria group bacterium]|nr:hypothetical protein [Patescibacteria group bacterium]MDD5490567.1 hypothetical protein [Patescibacteria group bacterium]